jgi:hypothetical protein
VDEESEDGYCAVATELYAFEVEVDGFAARVVHEFNQLFDEGLQ